MRQRGFSLVELVLVVAIMATLLGIATLQFNRYTTKSNIEKQVREMYGELMRARSEAVMQKQPRSFDVTAVRLTVYPTMNGTGTPIQQTALKYQVIFDNSTVTGYSFDSRGLLCDNTGTVVTNAEKIICVMPAGNPAVVDSIYITPTAILMGKWNGSCDSAHFTAK